MSPQYSSPHTLLETALMVLIQPLINAQVARIDQLERQVQQLASVTERWVDTKTAMRLLHYKRPEALKELRERPGTLIRYKREGKTGKLVKYCTDSIAAHNEAKTIRRAKSLVPSIYA